MKFKKIKLIFPTLLATFSFQFYLGAIFGYYLPKNFSKKVGSLVFEFKKWRIHLHHWLLGTSFLISSFFFDPLPLFPFSLGFLSGLVFQGIYCYGDWYKILTKIK